MLLSKRRRSLKFAIAWFAICLGLLATPQHNGLRAEGKLSSIRDAVRNQKKKKEKEKEKQSDDHDSRDNDHHDDDGGNLFINIFASVCRPRHVRDVHYHLAPVTSGDCVQPAQYVESQCAEPQYVQPQYVESVTKSSRTLFAHYPYADGYDGYLMSDNWVPARPKTGALRGKFAYGTDFDDLDWWMTDFLVETSSGWGADFEWTYLTESSGPGSTTDLHLGDANILVRGMSATKFESRFGIGMAWLTDDVGTDLGFNGTGQFDFYPAKPLVLSGKIDLGTLGDAFAFHFNASSGIVWKHAELQLGYDYRRIGTVDFSGPSLGLRFWW